MTTTTNDAATLYTAIPGIAPEDFADVRAGERWEIEGLAAPARVIRVYSDTATIAAGYLRNDVHVHASRFVRPLK